MKKTLIIILCFLFTQLSFGQSLSASQAINKSGKQRAISQRIAKDYLMIVAGVKVEDATKDLDEYASIFNENIHDLTIYCKTKETKDILVTINEIWRQLRLEVSETPSADAALKVIEDANSLLVLSNALSEKIVSQSGLKSANLVNVSGKQRMYIQRASVFYLANYLKLSKDYTNQMKETITGFESGLTTLSTAPENTEDLNTLIKLQQQEWVFFKKSILNQSNMLPTSVFSSSNLMVREFDNITKMYEEIASKS